MRRLSVRTGGAGRGVHTHTRALGPGDKDFLNFAPNITFPGEAPREESCRETQRNTLSPGTSVPNP